MYVALGNIAGRAGVIARKFTIGAVCSATALTISTATLVAQQQTISSPQSLHGIVRDPLGIVVAGAQVDLLMDRNAIGHATTGSDGRFEFQITGAGRYSLHVAAATFEPVTVAAPYLKADANADVDVTLVTPVLTQQVTVTATGLLLPEAQTGASVTVLSLQGSRTLLEVQDPLRLAPGVQVAQAGQMGGQTGVSIRGGTTSANKVLIDGIPVNQIGGGADFSNIAAVGVQSVEILNEPNSVLYGADAMAGVINITTTRAATTRLPLFTYAGDAGNFHTYRNEISASTVYRQIDLFSSYARVQSSNSIPRSEFHNGTYAGNFGWEPNAANDVRVTVRHIDVASGQPNSIAFYGIADNAKQVEHDLYLAGAWNSQLTSKWHNLVRYGYVEQKGVFNDYSATGIYDPESGYYDGAPVTITGANGYTVSGQALFQYSNGALPYLERNRNRSLYEQTDYRISPHFVALAAFKYEAEDGSAAYAGSPSPSTGRGNYDYSVEFSGDVKNRLFYTGGTGLEENGLYGFAGTPRASLAYYLARPSSGGVFAGTKLHGTFGKGIKEPSVYQAQNSLYATDGPMLSNSLHIGPLGPETSRTFDGGVDQQLFGGHSLLGVTYFHNEYTNGVEYVPQTEFLGVYLNSLAFRAQGIEARVELGLGGGFFARGGYTYTDAVVQHSYSSDNAFPSYNTSFNFPNIPIGAYSPLVGARPFRVAPHTGYFALDYRRPKFNGSLTGTLVGKRDDSDFLSDSNFGTSLLLPNHNLDGSYERLELSGGYQVSARVNVYANVQNLLSEHYFEAFGYPALPLTFRSGVKFNFGGESWKLK